MNIYIVRIMEYWQWEVSDNYRAKMCPKHEQCRMLSMIRPYMQTLGKPYRSWKDGIDCRWDEGDTDRWSDVSVTDSSAPRWVYMMLYQISARWLVSWWVRRSEDWSVGPYDIVAFYGTVSDSISVIWETLRERDKWIPRNGISRPNSIGAV